MANDVNHENAGISGDEGYTGRKRLAMGKPLPEGNFGVDSMSSHNAGGCGTQDAHLKDHERGAGPPIGGNQANPNHGKFK